MTCFSIYKKCFRTYVDFSEAANLVKIVRAGVINNINEGQAKFYIIGIYHDEFGAFSPKIWKISEICGVCKTCKLHKTKLYLAVISSNNFSSIYLNGSLNPKKNSKSTQMT